MRVQGKQRAHENYKNRTRAQRNQRAREEDQEDVKTIDVLYIDSYVENKPSHWTIKIHFRYEALDSQEQQVARLLGPTLCTIVTLGHSWAPTRPAQRGANLFGKEVGLHG